MKQSSKSKKGGEILFQTVRRSAVSGEHLPAGQEPVRVMPYNQTTITTKELAEIISGRCTVKAPDVYATLMALSEVLTETLLDGNRLRVDGVGSFDISLTQKTLRADGTERQPKMLSDTLRSDDVCVNRVVFTPSRELQNALKHAVFVNSGVNAAETLSREEIDAFLSQHFSTQQVLFRRELEQHFDISQKQANRWLKILVDDGALQPLGPRNSRFYVPGNEH
ncbi:MAG: hypothetical protein J5814_06425 [Bacteroidaceae bacterium]|nr:hypothetical protein [Bacteroidaceae bacterium]